MLGMIATSLSQVCALTGLFLCFSYYLSHIRREYQMIIIFLLGDNLSSYYWEIYLLVKERDPEESLLTYFGWNIGYVMLLLLVLHIGERELKRYVHPLMFVSVPVSAAVFWFFRGEGSVLNSAWQCVFCALIALFSLQGLLYHRKRRVWHDKANGVYLVLLLFVLFQYGVTVSYALGLTSGAADLYSVFTMLNYIANVLLPVAVARLYGDRFRIDRQDAMALFKRIMRIVFLALVTGASAIGYGLASWMHALVDRVTGGVSAENAAQMIMVMLFIISGTLFVLVFMMMLVLSFRMHEQQQAYKEMVLKLEKQSADAANEAKSSFLADMSHEIRTPINAVLGMNEMILRESNNDRITTYARNLESAGKNLLSIINDILDFSKIEAGKMELAEAPYQLSSVLNDVSNMITFRARSKDLEFHVDVDETLPDRLYGDEVRVRQIITNLLTNAVKYTPEGSVALAVRGETIPDPALREEGAEPESPVAGGIVLLVDVKDTGIGIREEDIGNLFTKFGRVDLKQTNTIEGTGLGLAITENLLLMMKGDIRVQSVYGEGSVFSVRIPQGVVSPEPIGDFHRRFEEGLKSRKAYHESFRAPNAQVLVVDDTELNLVVIEGLLKTTEVKLDTASGGEEALRLTRKTPYDLILLDQRMPHMSGTETLRHIREQEDGRNRETPVICLTADAVQGARERYLAEGFSGYLSKPVEGRALEEALMQYLPAGKISRTGTESGTEAADTKETGRESEESFLRLLYDRTEALHFDEAIRYSGTEALLEKSLRAFYESLPEKTEEIRRFFEAGDYENYTIRVHALKSGARLVGATELSELAQKLEACGDMIR